MSEPRSSTPAAHPDGGSTRPSGATAVRTDRLPPEPGTPEELAAQWEAEKPPAAGPASNLAAGIVVVLLGVLGLSGALEQGIGSPARPGAGTWPFLISVGILALGIALVVTARQTADAERFSAASWLVLLGLATMVGFALVTGTIGFEIPGALLAFVWLKVLGREGWRTSILASLAMVVAFYLVFVVALRTSIPHLF